MTTGPIKRRIQRIQRHLGVTPDGLVGPETLTAIEEALFDDAGRNAVGEDAALTVSRKGLDCLVRHEIGSAAYYRRHLAHPIWPGGRSGVTIGIGYDLGHQTEGRIRADWSAEIGADEIKALTGVAGLTGEPARQAVQGLGWIAVSLDGAERVFYRAVLPRYARMVRRAYPGAEKLHPDAQAALLSLVYNRGASLSGPQRSEMAAIRDLVLEQDYEGIARQITAMKRLWADSGLDGLLKRRDGEALLVRQAVRPYAVDELVRV